MSDLFESSSPHSTLTILYLELLTWLEIHAVVPTTNAYDINNKYRMHYTVSREERSFLDPILDLQSFLEVSARTGDNINLLFFRF
jgi:hypothetical protein